MSKEGNPVSGEFKRRAAALILTAAITLGGASGCADKKYDPSESPISSSTVEVVTDSSTDDSSEVTTEAAPEKTVTPKDELNQQIQDFFNKEGDYAEEKIKSKMNTYGFGNQIENLKLGLFHVELGGAQGLLLDYNVEDEYILMLLGFERDDGVRFITPLAIPTYFYSGSDNPDFYINEYGSSTTPSSSLLYKGTDLVEIENYLSEGKGNLICISLVAFDNISKDVLSDEETMSSYDGRAGRFITEILNKINIYKKLREEVASNGIDLSSVSYNTSDVSNVELTLINSAGDINSIDMNTVPIVCSFKLIN